MEAFKAIRGPVCDRWGARGIVLGICEDLILFKAVAGRMIDLADIEELIHLHRDRLDRDYLNLWAAKLGVTLNKFS